MYLHPPSKFKIKYILYITLRWRSIKERHLGWREREGETVRETLDGDREAIVRERDIGWKERKDRDIDGEILDGERGEIERDLG